MESGQGGSVRCPLTGQHYTSGIVACHLATTLRSSW